MTRDSNFAEEFKASLKWHFEVGAGRIQATASEAAKKLKRLLELQNYLR
jgi:hypothetical protein